MFFSVDINQQNTDSAVPQATRPLINACGAMAGNSIACLWGIIARFGMPFWNQRGAKGIPKSWVLVPSRAKRLKNKFQNEISKKM